MIAIPSFKNFCLGAACILALSFNGCESSSTTPDNAHSEPRKFVLALTDLKDGTKSTFSWSDLDGSGGNAPVIDTIKLTALHSYTGIVTLFDDKNNEVTSTIKDEADQHQFFYQPKNAVATLMSVGYNDKDKNSLPVGLSISVGVLNGSGSKGSLNVVLGHYDDVKKDGTTRSTESDLDFDFPVLIQ